MSARRLPHTVANEDVLGRCRAEGRAALFGYLPVGFPTVEGSIEAMRVLVEAGCDVIEVGVPYSDPLMEGPVIQAAHQASLEAGTRQADVLRTVEAVAATGAPTVVMGYWNPVHRYGFRRWAQALKDAGGAGAITPDLIPEEAPEWLEACRDLDLDPIFLVAPSSTDARIAVVGRTNRGFVYAAAVMGVVGAANIIQGLAAIAEDEVFLAGGERGSLVLDLTGWGWVHLLLGAFLVAVAVFLVMFVGGDDEYEVTAEFQNASQLVKGNQVMVGGLAAGSVKTIELGEDGEAEVTFTVKEEFAPLPRGTTATVRMGSLSSVAGRPVRARKTSSKVG